MVSVAKAGAIVLVLLVIVAAVVLLGNQKAPSTGGQSTYPYSYPSTSPGAGGGTTYAPILMTDPAYVPANTQAVIVTYSSVAVHTSGTAGSGWINATGSGSVNLLAVVNTSKVIGYANVSTNSSINLIRLNITAASITVNGTTYNLTVPNNKLTIAVVGKAKINQTTGILVDLSPTVSAVYNQNTTTFMMAPAAKATVVTNVTGSARTNLGVSLGLSANARASLAASAPNITITAASVSSANNITAVSVTVKDNSNINVTLNNLFVYGGESVVASPASGAANLSVTGAVNGVLGGTASANARANALARLGLNIRTFQVLNFVVTSSGSIALPSGGADFKNSGYVLGPGTSVTFAFSGKLSYNNGIFQTKTVAGSPYQITVVGQGGAIATTTVTGS